MTVLSESAPKSAAVSVSATGPPVSRASVTRRVISAGGWRVIQLMGDGVVCRSFAKYSLREALLLPREGIP